METFRPTLEISHKIHEKLHSFRRSLIELNGNFVYFRSLLFGGTAFDWFCTRFFELHLNIYEIMKSKTSKYCSKYQQWHANSWINIYCAGKIWNQNDRHDQSTTIIEILLFNQWVMVRHWRIRSAFYGKQ